MGLKDAVAAFNAAVAQLIVNEPSKVKAKNAEQLTGGATATSIRAKVTKSDCKLGLVVNKPAPAEINTYPDSTEHYAGNASVARWISSLLAGLERTTGIGDCLAVKTPNTPWSLEVRTAVGSQLWAIVYGSAEGAAIKAGSKYLEVIDLESKVTWGRATLNDPWVATGLDWTKRVSPNRWYSNTVTGYLLYVNSNLEVTLF